MKLQKRQAIVLPVIALASCSFGPRLETSMPQIRSVPVLAGLSPTESFARARTFLASKQYGLAIELYKAASREPTLTAESLNGLAVAYDGIGRRDLAERYFQRALAARPGDERTKRNLAAFYAASGQDGKRRELLAEAAPAPTAPLDVQAERPLAAFAEAPAARIAPAVALDLRSPLGSTFRPLTVQATRAAEPVREAAPHAVPETTIVCTSSGDGGRPMPDDGGAEIFRVSIGEVFIMTRPRGASCSVQPGIEAGAPGDDRPSLSNRDYLGLVADYLDRLNNGIVPVADISHLWRAAFWPQGGTA